MGESLFHRGRPRQVTLGRVVSHAALETKNNWRFPAHAAIALHPTPAADADDPALGGRPDERRRATPRSPHFPCRMLIHDDLWSFTLVQMHRQWTWCM